MGMPPDCNCLCAAPADYSSSGSQSGVDTTSLCTVCGIAPVSFSLSGNLPTGAEPSPCCDNYKGPVTLTHVSGCTWQSSTKAMYQRRVPLFENLNCFTPAAANTKPMYTLVISGSAGNLTYTVSQVWYTYSGDVSAALKITAQFAKTFTVGDCLQTRVVPWSSQASSTLDTIPGSLPNQHTPPPCGTAYTTTNADVTLTPI